MIDFKTLLEQPQYQPLPVMALGDRLIISPIANKQVDLFKLAVGSKGQAIAGAFADQALQSILADLPANVETTASGLIVPYTKEDRVFAVVVSTGTDIDPDDSNKPQVGDIIYYNTYAAGDIPMMEDDGNGGEVEVIKKLNVIELFGYEYRYIKERDILARYVFGKDFSETINVLANRVLVKPDAATTMIGSILIPEDEVEIPTTGTVAALGNELKESFDKVQVGSRILYHAYGGSELIIHELGKSDRYIALRESEVMAIIEDAL